MLQVEVKYIELFGWAARAFDPDQSDRQPQQNPSLCSLNPAGARPFGPSLKGGMLAGRSACIVQSPPMILGAHVIFSAHGFWLPNDPRGSWSDFVRAWELLKYGPATKTDERRSVAGRRHDSALRAAAKKDLMYPPVIFTGKQAAAISYGFADVVLRTACVIYACATMPDHTHLVIGRHRYSIQQVVNLLKSGATTSLRKHNLDPLATFSGDPEGRAVRPPSPWAHKFWKVWLDSEEDIHRSIDYVKRNPLKAGLKAQTWKFVAPYHGEQP